LPRYLLIVRVAGNVLGPSITAIPQYASAHPHTPLFVVLGHDGCGAVQAAIAGKFQGTRHQRRIEALLANIAPALDGLDAALPSAELPRAAVGANLRRTMRLLLESPEGKAFVEGGTVKLAGAVYELEMGEVRFLE
jgi:carbonic anhydrase